MSLRRPVAALLALAASVCLPEPAQAWGFTAHRMLNRKAVLALPQPLRGFFESNAAYVAEHSIDPDLQRSGPNDPDHFLDMDSFGEYPFPDIPRVEKEHLAKFGADAVARGRVPWKVGEVYRELVDAFRRRDHARALERAAALGHFIGDSHVPLHSATNYDGQLSGQTGLHGRWESELVERFERQIDAATPPEPARPVGDPMLLTFEILLESYQGYRPGLASDLASRGEKDLADTPADDRYDDSYYSKLYEREGTRLAARLAKAASRLGSLWLTAWQEAGRPALDPQFRIPYVRRQTPALLVALDGGVASLIEEAIARGVMPSLARLRRAGASGRGSAGARSEGLDTLWTGTSTEPGGGRTSTRLEAEPIWVTAARQGLDVTVVGVPEAYPFAPFTQERRFGGNYGRSLTLLDGQQSLQLRERTWTEKELELREPSGWLGPLPGGSGQAREVALDVAGMHVDGLVYDDPSDPTSGFDTLYLTLDKDPSGGVTLKPAPAEGADASAFQGLRLRLANADAAVYFRLFALSSDARSILLYQAGARALRSNRPRVEQAAFDATGGFVGGDAGEAFARGALGPTLAQGGDGTAERRYLETVALVARQHSRLADFAIERTAWDLLLVELPHPGAALRTGLRQAPKAQPYVDDALRLADAFVGRLVQSAGTGTIVAVAFGPGTLAIAGPGVAAEADLGTIREIDVAPTLCALLGLTPPTSAAGRVLDAALARRP